MWKSYTSYEMHVAISLQKGPGKQAHSSTPLDLSETAEPQLLDNAPNILHTLYQDTEWESLESLRISHPRESCIPTNIDDTYVGLFQEFHDNIYQYQTAKIQTDANTVNNPTVLHRFFNESTINCT